MNPENTDPEDAKLRALLHESRENPGLPPGFQQSVWRRIERAEARPAPHWLETFTAWLLRPRLALAGFAAVMLLGAVLGANAGGERAVRTAQARYVTAVDPFQKAP